MQKSSIVAQNVRELQGIAIDFGEASLQTWIMGSVSIEAIWRMGYVSPRDCIGRGQVSSGDGVVQ
eukprot:1106299-Rhodomonas_salina.2